MGANSSRLFQKACELMPGGVNSPVRACKNVDAEPLFINSAQGSRIWDADGRGYIDYVLSWGPMLLGHAHPQVTAAIREAAEKGASYGAPCEAEIILAEKITTAMPWIEMLRMVNSGTEATMSALRLARGFTGRDMVLKFTGCYHGHADPFLAAAGSGAATFSVPGSPGIPAKVTGDTLLAPYNDLDVAQELFEKHGDNIAAIIVEPVAANMGLVLPRPGFLEGLRELADKWGALLIFDEVITGFRLGYSGAAGRFGIRPDLTTLGKIIGGGLPVGCFGGRADIMKKLSPEGPVYQAGTLSGNPLAMAAGIATLSGLEKCDYAELECKCASFADNLASALGRQANVRIPRIASMFAVFFTDKAVENFDDAQACDSGLYKRFYSQMRDAGVHLAPSPYETGMLSFAHTDEDFDDTIKAAERTRLE